LRITSDQKRIDINSRQNTLIEWQRSLAFCLFPLFSFQVSRSTIGFGRISCFRQYHVTRLEGEITMNYFDSMLKRNQDFATQQSAAGAQMPTLPRALPKVKSIIIGCADMRVDPAHILGIKSGEAVVIRNIGGRITPGLLEQLGLLGRIGEVADAIPGGGGEFHIIVLQHTDCGITRLAGDTSMLAHYFQIQEGEVKTKTVTDPHAAVAADVAALRAIPALPAAWLISGLVYDVATGMVKVVIPPAPIRAEVSKAA
jgi:carbonic anhydrase